MQKKWKQVRKGAIAVSCCMLVLGILMILWPDISALTVCVILGVFYVAAGIYTFVRYFKIGLAGIFFFRSDLTFGICSVLLGIVLLLHPYGAMMLLPIVVGIFIIIGSVMDIQVSIEMHRFQFENWGMIMALGIISTVFAFLLMMNPFQGALALMTFIGISLVVGSIENFYAIYCISKAVKTSRIDKIIDTEWYSAD